MENLNRVAELAISQLKKNGADRAQIEVGAREVHELNVEAGRFTLLRTTFDQGVSLRAIVDQKQAVMSGNQFGETDVVELAKQTMAAAKTSAPDEAFDIAPVQPPKKFKSGPTQGDTEMMCERADEFLNEVKQRFSTIIIEQMTMQFVKRNRTVANTNGIHFEAEQSDYEVSSMFTAKDGRNSSSFNYTGMSATDFKTPILKMGAFETLLRQSTEQTQCKSIDGKFVGDIIVTPDCLPTFLGGITSHLCTGALLRGQSVYQDKLGQKIAHESFNLRVRPRSPEFSLPKYVTSDGYESQDMDIIESGVLKTYLLNQYGANKLKEERAKSDDDHNVIDPGSTGLKDLIRSTKRGVLLCRFSGGSPAINGDVSGVAKNSYLIEDGEIKYAINESMISGNIPEMFLNISGISRETINFGSMISPWVRFSGVTISGK
jgi:PmbA protein